MCDLLVVFIFCIHVNILNVSFTLILNLFGQYILSTFTLTEEGRTFSLSIPGHWAYNDHSSVIQFPGLQEYLREAHCNCITLNPSAHNATVKCNRMKSQKIRRRPQSCHAYHPHVRPYHSQKKKYFSQSHPSIGISTLSINQSIQFYIALLYIPEVALQSPESSSHSYRWW